MKKLHIEPFWIELF